MLSELHREPNPVVGAAHLAHQVKVDGVEVEVAGKLLTARGAGITALASTLLVGEKSADHSVRNS
jgi:hypothetical protein